MPKASDRPSSVRTVWAYPGDPEHLQRALDAAERELICRREADSGVLVTRVDERMFTVELSDDVPPGTTLERDLT